MGDKNLVTVLSRSAGQSFSRSGPLDNSDITVNRVYNGGGFKDKALNTEPQ